MHWRQAALRCELITAECGECADHTSVGLYRPSLCLRDTPRLSGAAPHFITEVDHTSRDNGQRLPFLSGGGGCGGFGAVEGSGVGRVRGCTPSFVPQLIGLKEPPMLKLNLRR